MIYSFVGDTDVATISQHLSVSWRKFSSSGVVIGRSVSMASCSRVRCLGGKCVHFLFLILSGGVGFCRLGPCANVFWSSCPILILSFAVSWVSGTFVVVVDVGREDVRATVRITVVTGV